KEGNDYDTLLPVPYWSWQDKKSEVLQALVTYKNDQEVTFCWDLIKDNIDNCQCFISGKQLEISTLLSPIEKFGTFSKAQHKILMSATTQNDSFFIKGLGINTNAIKNPLVSASEKWSGEKMIIIPSLIRDDLNRESIINYFAKAKNDGKFGRVVITSSFKKAEFYKNLGSVVTQSNTIFEEVKKLKFGNYSNTIVIVNRYDGIDLPDDACRILIIDSMPYSDSLTERYEEECRENSDLVNIKAAQKIEQGFGRSVRGEKDYSVILVIGNDLVKFLRSASSNRFFSNQTQKQIELGIEISQMAKEDVLSQEYNFIKIIYDLIGQCINRDEGWKEFYKERMDESTNNRQQTVSKIDILKILELERKAEESFYKNETEKAIKHMQSIIDFYETDECIEKGWYLQTLARYQYKLSKSESNKIQKNAYKKNSQLLKPKEGISYQRLSYINENRIKRINNWISSYKNHEELMMSVNEIVENLSFGQLSEKFEKALQNLGNAIGFLSQRPDKEFKKGPDNLWCASKNDYFIFECKSEVEDSRNEITKTETGQMNNHCAWFEQEYNTEKVKRILIIPTKKVSVQGNFTHDVEIMRKGKLKSLRDNVKSFFKEFKDYILTEISDSKIQELIAVHKLDIQSLKNEYSEKYYQQK
ncbi:MAG: hypothetical protein RLZZ574_2687, partial [Cyanobacteriota bacterium]